MLNFYFFISRNRYSNVSFQRIICDIITWIPLSTERYQRSPVSFQLVQNRHHHHSHFFRWFSHRLFSANLSAFPRSPVARVSNDYRSRSNFSSTHATHHRYFARSRHIALHSFCRSRNALVLPLYRSHRRNHRE